MGKLVGIGGLLESGKDTVADYLVGKGWIKFGMSDPLHQSMMKLDPIVASGGDDGVWTYVEATGELGYTEAKARFPEYRRLLQVFGTEVGRDLFGENVWVDIMAKRASAALEGGHNVIVTGLRFINEIEAIIKLGGETWWVDRGFTPTSQHASENSVTPDDFDVIIDNTGSIEDLYTEVDIYR